MLIIFFVRNCTYNFKISKCYKRIHLAIIYFYNIILPNQIAVLVLKSGALADGGFRDLNGCTQQIIYVYWLSCIVMRQDIRNIIYKKWKSFRPLSVINSLCFE